MFVTFALYISSFFLFVHVYLIFIYFRVSYCTVDVYYDKVFCYISRNGETKELECHAFLCNKRSKVSTVVL